MSDQDWIQLQQRNTELERQVQALKAALADRVAGAGQSGGSDISPPVSHHNSQRRLSTPITTPPAPSRDTAPASAGPSLLERTLLALQRSEARYKTLLQQHPDPIARCRADGTITAANTAFAHYFGQFEQPVIGDSLWALVQPDHDLQAQLECGFEQLRHADPDQRIVQFEHRPTPTDRQQWWHWILSGIYERDAQLLEVQLIGHRGSDRQEVDPLAQTPDLDADLATDIRQLTQANQQLQLELQHQQATWQQSEARHRAIVTSLQEGVMVINAAGQVQTCNASAAKMLGLNVPELLRHCLFDRQWQWLQTNAMPLPLHDHPAQLTLQTGIPCIAVNLGLQRPDQTRLWLSVNTQPRFHARELLPYEVIVSLTDRTQQQQAEHDRQALLRREQAAQAQVTQTKAQIEEILESVTDSFIACDRDWHFTYVNREAARTIGRSRKSLLGKVLWQEFPEFAHSSIAQFLKQSQRQHTVSEIVEYYAPCDRWYSLRVHPSPKEIAIYFRDMTDTFHHIDERNQVAADLQESQERLRQLTENIPQVFWLYDLQEQRIIYISRACQTVLGVAPERASQKNWHDWLARVHADDRAAVSKASKRPFTGRSGEVTYRFMRPDSTVRWLHGRAFPVRNAAGKVYRVAGMVEDVSDRQQKENWLTLLESVIINANDAVVITAANPIELPGPRIIFVNSAFSKMMGYSREEVLGKTPRLLQGPKTDPAKLASVRSALKHRQPLRVELINYRKDGSEVWIELSIFPVTDTLGHCNYWVGIQRDITQRKQAEADLEKTLRQERELSELKSRFISTTSHEFRTPLSTILSSVDLLEYYAERLIASEERSRYVEHTRRIQNAALNMNHLLNDLLIIEQAEANGWQLEPIELNLREFFQHLIDEMRFNDQNHHPITFQVRRSDGILEQNVAVMVHMDERLLRQIFSNLLSNALKYSPIDTPINVRMHCSKDQIIVQIRDRGIGIPAIDQTRLFEPFHRATNVGTVAGTGLGLAITKQAVDRHSGSIIIRSKVQQGTIVTVRLPRHPPHHQPATAPPLNMDAQTLDRPHINSHSLDPPNRQTPLNHQPHGE